MLAEASESGLILPTPAPATVTLGVAADFDDLEVAIAPRVEVVDDWWGSFALGDGAAGGAPPDVLSTVQLGPVEASTLAASDAQGLREWLDAHGYGIRPEVQQLLDGYVARGWYFVVLRLTGELPLDGELDPVRFTFASDELVYPLDLSRAAELAQSVRLYVFDEHRVDAVPLGGGAVLPQQQVLWSGPAPAGFEDRGARLTVLTFFFADPAAEIPGDLRLVDAPSDEPVEQAPTRVAHLVEVAGVPAGWLILGAGVVLGVLLAVAIPVAIVLVVLRRAARSQPS